MTGKKYDVIVVGGGPGGLSSAALLAQSGVKTLLLEKNERTGGKAMSISRGGFTYEMWPIGVSPVKGHAFEALFKKLGIESKLKLIAAKRPASAYRGRSGKWRISVASPETERDPTGRFDNWELDAKERELATKVLAEVALMPPEKVVALDDITFDQFLAQYEVPGPVYSYLAFFSNGALAEPIDLVSASEYIGLIQDVTTNGGGSYPAGGVGHVADVIAEAFKANGGEVETGARVERIEVQDSRVTGVRTKQGTIEAPIVVSNAGIHPTVLKLVGEEHFERSYVDYVKDLVAGWGFTGQRYFLSKQVLDFDMCTVYSDESWLNVERLNKIRMGHIPDDVLVYGMVTSNYDPDMAPPGKQLLIAGTICSPDPEATEIEMLWDKMDETLFKLWPDMAPAIESKDRAGPREISNLSRDHVLPGQGGEAVGMGQIAGQCGRHKPSAKAPIPGLFYVGCDAGGSAMGTHQATGSGINVAEMVLQYHQERQAEAQGGSTGR